MATNKKYKSISYYLDLPWTYTITTEIENHKKHYVVHVNELPGICSDGTTFQEAMQEVTEAIKAVIMLYIKNKEEIPEPISEEKFKGKISYRTTSSRHYFIAKEAQKRGLSLSETIDYFIDTRTK